MAQRDTNLNPTLRDDIADEDRRLIREFFAHTASGNHTKHRYATQLGEFAAWLTHDYEYAGWFAAYVGQIRDFDSAQFWNDSWGPKQMSRLPPPPPPPTRG